MRLTLCRRHEMRCVPKHTSHVWCRLWVFVIQKLTISDFTGPPLDASCYRMVCDSMAMYLCFMGPTWRCDSCFQIVRHAPFTSGFSCLANFRVWPPCAICQFHAHTDQGKPATPRPGPCRLTLVMADLAYAAPCGYGPL